MALVHQSLGRMSPTHGRKSPRVEEGLPWACEAHSLTDITVFAIVSAILSAQRAMGLPEEPSGAAGERNSHSGTEAISVFSRLCLRRNLMLLSSCVLTTSETLKLRAASKPGFLDLGSCFLHFHLFPPLPCGGHHMSHSMYTLSHTTCVAQEAPKKTLVGALSAQKERALARGGL